MAYGLMGYWLNFYHDEIPILWFHIKMGDVGIFFEGNRPLLKWIYQPLLMILGAQTWGWITLSVISRWLHAISVYWLLRKVWPDQENLWKISGLFVLVYPGFEVQFASMIFSIAFLVFSCLLISIFLNLKALVSAERKKIYLLFAMMLSAVSLFTSEYFIFLELIRYPLVWVFLRGLHKKDHLKQFLLSSSSFLALFLASLVWRLQVQATETTYSIQILDQLKPPLMTSILSILSNAVKDIFQTTAGVWGRAIYPHTLLLEQGRLIIVAFVGLIALTALFLYTILTLLPQKEQGTSNQPTPKSIWVISSLSLFLAGVPFWVAGLPIGKESFFSRWSIPFMVGAGTILPVIVASLISKRSIRLAIFSLMTALAIGLQFLSANSFRHDFEKQNSLYWQFIWRIPYLDNNTVIFSDILDFKYENSDQLSMGINFALARETHYTRIPYFLYYIPERLGTSILPDLRPDQTIPAKRYYSSFISNSSDALVIDFQHPACLKILEAEIDIHNPNISPLLKDALTLADNDRIRFGGNTAISSNVTHVIGNEPRAEWCYYFQKADLYRQFGQWFKIEDLFQELDSQQLMPRDGREWFPFIEGFAHLNKWEQALNISYQALNQTNGLHPALCAVWERILVETEPSLEKTRYLSVIRSEINCE